MTSTTAGHDGGAVWSTTPPNIQSFTTKFTFQMPHNVSDPTIAGLTFCVQNSNSTTNPGFYGVNALGDANLAGYGVYASGVQGVPNQTPIGNSLAVKFDLNYYNQQAYPVGGLPNSTGLYINGGPLGGLIGENDLNLFSLNLYSGDIFSATIVYDGTLLTMTLKDASTGAQGRYVWPINIPAVTRSNTAWVGFTANEVQLQLINLLSWQYYTGYNTRLAQPTFSVPPGQYTTAQSVSLNGPPGATIYYTTNGQLPTTSSKQYSGTPILINTNEIIQAVAIESGYTDSLVATGNYQIQAASAPLINFSNFSSPNGFMQLAGYGYLSGPNLVLTDANANSNFEATGAWYPTPVSVQKFSTTFTYQATQIGNTGNNGFGATFAIQNQPQTTNTGMYGEVTGGPTYVGYAGWGLGYGNMNQAVSWLNGSTGGLTNSIAVKFDLTNNTTGLYTNGLVPSVATQPDVSITGGVNLLNGNRVTIAFTYNGTTLSMKLTDTVTSNTFSYSWPINIPSTVGANTAYVGFTGATGYSRANQYIQNWTYSNP